MNIDEMLNQFRIASRELFNNYFRVSNPYGSGSNAWLLDERFSEIEEVLFKKIVIEPAAIEYVKYGEPQRQIQVELRSGEFAPILLNRDISSGYWDHSLNEVTSNVKLAFLSFFDWDKLDYRDNRYVQVEVKSWPLHPEAVGKHALIESQYVKFAIL